MCACNCEKPPTNKKPQTCKNIKRPPVATKCKDTSVFRQPNLVFISVNAHNPCFLWLWLSYYYSLTRTTEKFFIFSLP